MQRPMSCQTAQSFPTVMASDAQPLTSSKALGFIGIMVQGGHHQPHHLMMAKGQMSLNRLSPLVQGCRNGSPFLMSGLMTASVRSGNQWRRCWGGPVLLIVCSWVDFRSKSHAAAFVRRRLLLTSSWASRWHGVSRGDGVCVFCAKRNASDRAALEHSGRHLFDMGFQSGKLGRLGKTQAASSFITADCFSGRVHRLR